MTKGFFRLFLSTILMLLFFQPLAAEDAKDNNIKDRLRIKRTLEYVNAYHFKPKPIDDTFSEQVFDLYIKRIDPNKQFFTQEDIRFLEKYKKDLDDQLLEASPEFHNRVSLLRERRVKQAQAFSDEFLNVPMDFSIDEFLVTDTEELEFVEDFDSLKEVWRKSVKAQVLAEYLELVRDDAVASANVAEFKPEFEKKARENIQENLDNFFENLNKVSDEEHLAIFLDSITHIYDPHTSYFLPEKKEDFDIGISGRLEGIGAVLTEEDNYIKVLRIVVGSAAWRQKELQADDLILKVGQGDKSPVNVVGLRVRDAVKLIRGKKGTEVRLTVKKPDESIKVIPIVRDVVVIEETYAKSTVIELKEEDIKVGYIYLPGFYRDFNDFNNRNSADDVKNALNDLQAKGVDGIILDFRNNGGGSLKDAVDITGHFIPVGPVVQIKDNSSDPQILEDRNTSVVYKGPLIVMIDQYSASASEIVAGALQDYGRAIIVGAKGSYGKGTVQTFVNLDQSVPYPYLKHRPLGSVKLTFQQFYRINGDSTQFKGVTPDIVMPTVLDFREIGERKSDYALPWTSVAPLKYDKHDEKLHLSKLRKRSHKRIGKSEIFELIESRSSLLGDRKNSKTRPLSLVEIVALEDKEKEEDKRYDIIKEFDSGIYLPTPNFSEDKEEQERDKFVEWRDGLKKDPYLVEAIHIMKDYKQLKK